MRNDSNANKTIKNVQILFVWTIIDKCSFQYSWRSIGYSNIWQTWPTSFCTMETYDIYRLTGRHMFDWKEPKCWTQLRPSHTCGNSDDITFQSNAQKLVRQTNKSIDDDELWMNHNKLDIIELWKSGKPNFYSLWKIFSFLFKNKKKPTSRLRDARVKCAFSCRNIENLIGSAELCTINISFHVSFVSLLACLPALRT